MNTKINLTYDDVNYTLEFNRMTVKILENAGFNMEEFLSKPMVNIELVFAAAFMKNHPKVEQSVVDEIFKNCPDKNGLIANLTVMINECYDSLLAEPEEDAAKKATWEVVNLAPVKKEKKVQE